MDYGGLDYRSKRYSRRGSTASNAGGGCCGGGGGGGGLQWALLCALGMLALVEMMFFFSATDHWQEPLDRPTDSDLRPENSEMRGASDEVRQLQLAMEKIQVLESRQQEMLRQSAEAQQANSKVQVQPVEAAAVVHRAPDVAPAENPQALQAALALVGRLELELQEKERELISLGKYGSLETTTAVWSGPVDLDDAAEKHMQEMMQEWDGRGAVEADRPGIQIANWEKWPPWPFQKLKTLDKRDTGAIALCAPFTDNYYQGTMERATFWRLKANGHVMVGITSYMHFPGEIHNPINRRHVKQDGDILRAMDGWLHCFREPDKYIPQGIPRMMISESDFYDPFRNDGGGVLVPKNLEKKYDFIYVNGGGQWNDYNRNWTLAREAIIMFARDMGLSTYVTGHPIRDDPDMKPFIESGLIIPSEKQLWRDFLDRMDESRAVFMPNVHDASPRVITEGLCKNVPVLMNWHIAGGWKYVNDQTGVFFHDMSDVRQAVERLRDPQFAVGLKPRDFFVANFGKQRAAGRLHAFLDLVIGPARLASAAQIRTQNVEDERRH